MRRQRILPTALLLAAVTPVFSASTGADEGPTVPGSPPRLSGIVAVAGEPRLAVLELPGRGGRLVRVGDRLADGAEVAAIGPDWVRLAVHGQERLLRLAGLPAGAAGPAAPREGAPPADASPPITGPDRGVVDAGGELGDLIAGVASDRGNPVEALADVVGAYLGLPPATEITVSDVAFGPFASAAAAKAELDRQGMIRVQIGSGQVREMLYLRAVPPQEAAVGAGGPPAVD